MGRTSDARERLVQAGIDLIWTRSYGAVSVDALCERAGVKKGSFYHFFESKDDLVLASLDAHWAERRPVLDALFDRSIPPLERLESYFQSVYTRQLEVRARYGRVLGCFYLAVGVECGAKENPAIAKKVQSILLSYERYYESALADAAKAGLLGAADTRARARSLFAFMEGVLGQARITDDLAAIRDIGRVAFQFLGLGAPDAGPAPRRGKAERAAGARR